MIGNDSPARCHLPHFARHLAGTCDCAHCHFGLTRAREYCFFLRKQVVAVARVFEESQVVTSLFPDVKEVKIELEDEEAFCKNLFGHELNQVSAPGGGVFAFELPRDVVCVARGSRFRLQLPRGGRGLKISALDPRATGSSSTAAGIQQDLLVMGQDSPEPEEENDDAGYVEQGTREEEDDDTPEDEELDFVEQHDQQQAQGVTPGGRVEYIRASAQRASLISATPRSGLFTPTPRHSTLNASSFAPQKSQFTVPGLGLVLGITPRTEYGDSTQHLYSARRSYDAVATPRSMGEVKTTSAPLLTSRSSAVLSTTPHAVGAAPATRTPRWSTSTTTLVGASALPSARQRYSILSRSATKRPIRVTGAATTPSPVEQVHQLSKTATSAISSQQNALHPASPVYRGILPGRAVNVDPRSHRVTVGPAPRMIFAPVVLPSSTGARSGVGSGYSIGYGSYGAIMKMAHHGVVGLRRFRENVR
ncbi:unnamed protein product [Amoebophrya sp. A25]|nr:unnamed protein product [Amoebophrya sp. A25]|eukprot:GSA25T00014625001.1